MTLVAMNDAWPAIGLATCRVAGVCLWAPILASAVVPRRIALGLAAALAVAALPAVVMASPEVPSGGAAWIGAAAMQFAVGAVIGFLAFLPLAGLRAAGALAGVQMGFGFGSLYEGQAPEGEAADPVERVMALAALAVFAWAGGLDSLVLGVLRSFEYLPIGSALSMAALPEVLARGALACAELAVRVALPVSVVLVAEALVTGALTRAVPSLGPVQFGFPVRVAIGLLALAAGAGAVQDALHGATGSALQVAASWVQGGAL